MWDDRLLDVEFFDRILINYVAKKEGVNGGISECPSSRPEGGRDHTTYFPNIHRELHYYLSSLDLRHVILHIRRIDGA